MENNHQTDTDGSDQHENTQEAAMDTQEAMDAQEQAEGERQLAERAHNLKRGNQIGLAASIPRMVAIMAVLAIAESCLKSPLREWVAMLLAADALRTPLRLRVLAQLCSLEQTLPTTRSASAANSRGSSEEGQGGANTLTRAFDAIDKGRAAVLNRWISGAVLALNAAGAAWLLQAKPCAETSPHLYRLCLALTLIFAISVGLNLCCSCVYATLVLTFRCCGPLLVRWRGVGQGSAADTARLGTGLDAGALAEMEEVPFDPAEEVHARCSSCAVCLSDFEAGEACRKLMCRHVFHKACADEWLQIRARCPLCNRQVDPRGKPGDRTAQAAVLENESDLATATRAATLSTTV